MSDGFQPEGPLDPVAAQIAAFFAADPGWQEMTSRPIAETRAAIRAATPVTGQPEMECVEDFRIPVSGGEIGLRLYRPGPHPSAIIVWAHGGGFALGSIAEIDNFARVLAKESGCAVASVEYRLAPEHPFPTAVNDLLRAASWVCDRVVALAGDKVPIILGGDSAGANLATVVTRKLHETTACKIAGNVLAYPNTDTPETPSLRRFEAPFLGLREIEFFLGLYVPDTSLHRHPDFAPLYAPGLELLPPTLIITAEHDLLTEQAEAYGQVLAARGVRVSIIRHPGMIHGFVTMDAFFAGAAGLAMRQISHFVRGLGNP
ncbi:alpha/beta hydrolase [Novosphingobium sp. G106]|uniref:alpha/beta hydrolase n=1 Tax=Novosphingobium sp. G106 TaxID=2849500 RepID=UPI001C2D5ABD|nr:alpha/beta hydrolase [Novosphingobium sp. G106]MBV1688240.1 alpha/beta hydrolase [Novosphingobium sp. G106]